MIFSFGRKAQFEKLLHELKGFVFSQSVAVVAEEDWGR
jgi:hypothetical protein